MGKAVLSRAQDNSKCADEAWEAVCAIENINALEQVMKVNPDWNVKMEGMRLSTSLRPR